MKTIQIGEPFPIKYDFRETCFGIVEIDNKLLLINNNNQYSLVGGGIEPNETKEECLKREFLEESGYTVTNIKALIAIDCYWLAAGKYPMLSKANIYIVNIDENSKQEPLEKGHHVKFIDINEVKDLLPLPYHKKAIEYYLDNKNI